MSDESPLQTRLTTDVPLASGAQENYIHLLVLLCVFAGGILILLSILIIFCHRCCERQRRHSRASEDQEKTNTTYIEESQPTQDVTIRMDSGEPISTTSCCGDTDGEQFLSVACTARRVSFNETAIHEQSSKDKERGRRYTLTEGDYHHLKRSRLTHSHIQTPVLKIVTILECDPPENNINISDESSHEPSLAIFQPGEGPSSDSPVLWTNQNSSCALPGDSLNTSVTNSKHSTKPQRSQTLEMLSRNVALEEEASGGGSGLVQGSMLNFLSKLRRHASLEGAAPFYSVKKWSFDTIQRAASLDMRGSPRRRAFQRQRAASETLDPEEDHLQGGVCDFLLRNSPAQPQTDPPRRLSAGSLEPGAGTSLSRLEVKSVMQLSYNTEADISSCGPVEMKSSVNGHTLKNVEEFGPESYQESFEQPSLYRDIWSLRASLELYASSDLSSNDRDSTRSDADSVCSVGASRAAVTSYQSQDIDDEMDGDGELPYDDAARESGMRRNGRDSVDSDRGVDGETTNRKLLQMDSGYASIEAPCKPPEEFRLFGSASGKTASERRRFFTNAGRKGTVCESFEARLFKEELEDEVSESTEVKVSPKGFPEVQPTVKPKVPFRRRDYSIDEKTEALFNEFLRHDPQFDQQGSPSLRHRHRSRIHLRKQWQRSKQYSDPGAARYSPSLERQRCYPLRRGDSANYPLDTRYHSTLPRIASAADEEASEGAAGTESPEPENSALKPEGAGPSSATESPGPDLEENANNSSNNMSCYFSSSHSQCNSARDHGILEGFETTAHTADTHKHSETEIMSSFSHLHSHTDSENLHHTHPDPIGSGCVHHILTDTSPSDKLVSALDDRLYSNLRTHIGNQECVVTVSRTSPDLGEE